MGETAAASRFTLRDLPLVSRVVTAIFLMSVGIGYFSALVQLHFQQANAGELLPGPDQVKGVYYGKQNAGLIEKLITAPETLPFNGSGQMRAAFFGKARGWKRELRELAAEKKIPEPEAEKLLRQKRAFEITALLAWLHDGAKEQAWDQGFALPDEFFKDYPKDMEPDDKFFQKSDAGKWSVKVSALVDDRCARCHRPGAGGAAGQIHLDTFANMKDYIHPDPQQGSSAMSLMKLAQTTHIHLLAFSMLYFFSGLIFSLTSYPGMLRTILAPLPLVCQVFEISCWWLARAEPIFALGIMLLGGVVGASFGSQILLSLFDLFEKKGKLVLMLVAIALLCVGGVVWVQVVMPQLVHEKVAGGM